MTPRFLIGKYAPDLHRMEPRNFGVIVWSAGEVAARFLGEQNDGRVRAPAFVQPENRSAYRQWIQYWRIVLAQTEIKTVNGQAVARSSPEFTDAIKAKAKPHFLLVDGGFALDVVPSQELADELFARLVEDISEADARAHYEELRRASNEVLTTSGIRNREDFKKNVPVDCKIGPVTKPFKFDYAIVDTEVPRAVFQRVLVFQEKSVNSTAFMFERLKQSRSAKLKRIGRFAFVYSVNGQLRDELRSNVRLLEQYANVVDVSRLDEAALHIRSAVRQ